MLRCGQRLFGHKKAPVRRIGAYRDYRHKEAVAVAQRTHTVHMFVLVMRDKAENELVGLTKRVRTLEEDFETTESRLVHTSTKLDEASKASDENERYDNVVHHYHGPRTTVGTKDLERSRRTLSK